MKSAPTFCIRHHARSAHQERARVRAHRHRDYIVLHTPPRDRQRRSDPPSPLPLPLPPTAHARFLHCKHKLLHDFYHVHASAQKRRRLLPHFQYRLQVCVWSQRRPAKLSLHVCPSNTSSALAMSTPRHLVIKPNDVHFEFACSACHGERVVSAFVLREYRTCGRDGGLEGWRLAHASTSRERACGKGPEVGNSVRNGACRAPGHCSGDHVGAR